jgi:hypothetical protein
LQQVVSTIARTSIQKLVVGFHHRAVLACSHIFVLVVRRAVFVASRRHLQPFATGRRFSGSATATATTKFGSNTSHDYRFMFESIIQYFDKSNAYTALNCVRKYSNGEKEKALEKKKKK